MSSPVERLEQWCDTVEDFARNATLGNWHVTVDLIGIHLENGDGEGRIAAKLGTDRLDHKELLNANLLALGSPEKMKRVTNAYRVIIAAYRKTTEYEEKSFYSGYAAGLRNAIELLADALNPETQ